MKITFFHFLKMFKIVQIIYLPLFHTDFESGAVPPSDYSTSENNNKNLKKNTKLKVLF